MMELEQLQPFSLQISINKTLQNGIESTNSIQNRGILWYFKYFKQQNLVNQPELINKLKHSTSIYCTGI